ncbi:MAG: redoxin family protein [Planctomycetota bacterium]|nr:redoxin family protein [Planctomycetota bacterium]
MRTHLLSTILAAACIAPATAHTTPLIPVLPLAAAQESAEAAKPLTVGDKAPAIKVGTWVKGEPVTSFADGQVYVMEFWATWCGPCIRGIPHLTELQKNYKDKGVTIVGTAIWQREPTQEDRVATVTGFVDQQGDKMDYTIAVDDERSMSESWMMAAGRNGIPSAFIVGKDGTVEWIGHPATMDEPLEKIVDGSWDRDAFAAAEAERARQQQEINRVMTMLRSADTAEERLEAMKGLNGLIEKMPDNVNMKMIKYEYLIDHMSIASAVKFGDQVAKANWDDQMMLNSLSWMMVISDKLDDQGKDFALRIAQRADELTDNSDPMVLDTVARCWFVKGDVQKAIETQKKAIELADEDMAKQLQPALKEYEEAQDKI